MTQVNLSAAEQYEVNRPLREAACQKYYENKVKAGTIQQAEKTSTFKGNWICRVNTPEGNIFYTRTQFTQKWVKPGDVLGMWNELTLIKKA